MVWGPNCISVQETNTISHIISEDDTQYFPENPEKMQYKSISMYSLMSKLNLHVSLLSIIMLHSVISFYQPFYVAVVIIAKHICMWVGNGRCILCRRFVTEKVDFRETDITWLLPTALGKVTRNKLITLTFIDLSKKKIATL